MAHSHLLSVVRVQKASVIMGTRTGIEVGSGDGSCVGETVVKTTSGRDFEVDQMVM
jgi:hypothetical protein